MKPIEADQPSITVLDDSYIERNCAIRLFDIQYIDSTNVPVNNQIPMRDRLLGNINYTKLINRVTSLYQLV